MTEHVLAPVRSVDAPQSAASSATRRPAATRPPGHELLAVAARRASRSTTSLGVISTDDLLEREAAQAAERVTPLYGPSGGHAEAPAEGTNHTRNPATRAGATFAPAIVYEVLRSAGAPLDAGQRAFFEPRLGSDLSGVRIHRDAMADASARAVGAVAYTVGSDVVFAEGRYAPSTASGRRLLAHELAHVLQQRGPDGVQPMVARSTATTGTPEQRVADMLAEGEASAIRDISDEEIAAATPLQRAGLIRILTGLWWTGDEEEQATLRILRYGGENAQVAAALDALGYRQKVLASVHDDALHAELEELLGPAPADGQGGAITAALASQSPNDVMAITDFSGASAAQRLGLLRIFLEQIAVSAPEESKVLEILTSAGSELGALMTDLTSAGLKQALFDSIDDPPNKLIFTGLLTQLNDPQLKRDLAIFNQNLLEGWIRTVAGGYSSALTNMTKEQLGALITGLFQPFLHPIDTLMGLFEQIDDLTKDLFDLDRWLTLLRDATGLVGTGLVGLAAGFSGLAFGLSFIAPPAGVAVGAIAASLWTYAAAVGAAFLALAYVKLYLDAAQGSAATTEHAREREARDIGEGVTLLAAAASLGALFAGLKWMFVRVRGVATDSAKAEPDALQETADAAQKTAQDVTKVAEEMQAEAGVNTTSAAQPGAAGSQTALPTEASATITEPAARTLPAQTPMVGGARVVERPVVGEPVVEGPVVEGPVVEGPVVEGPVVEGPVVEGPAVETPPQAPDRPWQPGDEIDMPTATGDYPTYSSGEVRGRFWRDAAEAELQARTRGEVAQDPANRSDPLRSMSNDELRVLRDTSTKEVRAPRDPITGRSIELEHMAVQQSVAGWLERAGYSRNEALQLVEVASPRSLMDLSPLEHAFFDYQAWRFGSRRADVSGARWTGTQAADPRVARPLYYMPDAAITQIAERAAAGRLNFDAAGGQQLRAALLEELSARDMDISLP